MIGTISVYIDKYGMLKCNYSFFLLIYRFAWRCNKFSSKKIALFIINLKLWGKLVKPIKIFI